MALLLKVNRVDVSEQSDPYQRVKSIGGSSKKLEWQHTQALAIQSIERDMFCYYLEKDDRVLKLTVGLAPDGSKFLTTEDDGDQPQVLLSLIANAQLQAGLGLRS